MNAIASGIFDKKSLELIPEEEWPARIAANEASDRIFWNGGLVAATAYVELPFWLMTPDASFDLSYKNCKVVLTTHNDYVEVLADGVFLDSRANLLCIGPSSGIQHSVKVQNGTRPVVRPQKTVIEIQLMALESAFTGFFSDEAMPANRSAQYFSSLALAHLPFINLLIAAYRSSSRDPFAFEVSEWDVPVCWFRLSDQLVRSDIMPYWNNDELPGLRNLQTGEKESVFVATTEQINTTLYNPVPPGVKELLDANSLMYRGRYNDAIRSAVTAIEGNPSGSRSGIGWQRG